MKEGVRKYQKGRNVLREEGEEGGRKKKEGGKAGCKCKRSACVLAGPCCCSAADS